MSLVDLVIYNAEQIRGAASLTERLRNRLCHRPLHLIFFLLSFFFFFFLDMVMMS